MDTQIAAQLEPFRDYLRFLAHANIGKPLRSKIDPSDIAQQTIVRGCAGLPPEVGKSPPRIRAWLRTVLANVMADEFRKFASLKRNSRLEVSIHKKIEETASVLEVGIHASGVSPSEVVERKELVERVEKALLDLPEQSRVVLVLKHRCGLTVEEIAKRLNKTTAAVAGLLRRGLQSLREQLEGLGD